MPKDCRENQSARIAELESEINQRQEHLEATNRVLAEVEESYHKADSELIWRRGESAQQKERITELERQLFDVTSKAEVLEEALSYEREQLAEAQERERQSCKDTERLDRLECYVSMKDLRPDWNLSCAVWDRKVFSVNPQSELARGSLREAIDGIQTGAEDPK